MCVPVYMYVCVCLFVKAYMSIPVHMLLDTRG